jgi:hypothetical protein
MACYTGTPTGRPGRSRRKVWFPYRIQLSPIASTRRASMINALR